MRFRTLLVAGFCAAMFATVAYAQGLFPTLPIVGGSSFCGGFATGTSGQVCTTTVPAGPTATTGDETIPADTNLASGRAPQSVAMSMRALNAAPITYNLCAAAACGTVTIGNNSGGVLFDYTTTITSATVNLPVSPMDGQRVTIASPYTITTLAVVAGAGTSLAVTTPTVLTASTTVPQGYEFMYVASTTKWYKVH